MAAHHYGGAAPFGIDFSVLARLPVSRKETEMKTRSLIFVAPLALALALTSLGLAETPKPQSKLEIAWKVSLANGNTVNVVGEAGEPARLTLGEKTLALAPEVEDRARQVVLFRLLEISKAEGNQEAINQRERFSLRPGESYSSRTQAGMAVTLKGIESMPVPVESRSASGESIVKWQLELATGKINLAGAPGEMARVKSEGYTLGFRPTLGDESTVQFQIFRGSDEPRDQDLKELASVSLPLGARYTSKTVPQFSLTLTEVVHPSQ
jgi:hypothetical protein